MDAGALIAAIRADPDDDALRLAYADALEAAGEGPRAEWVRASCELAEIHYRDPRWDAAVRREIDAFRRCRPSWWEDLSNIDQKKDRGVFRLILGSVRSSRAPAAYKRLGKAAWLGTAMDEGWLQRIDVDFWDDELGQIVARWKEPASRIPLFVHPAPQVSDESLRTLLRLPQLEGLHLETVPLGLAAVRELASYPGLVELRIELWNVEREVVDAVLDQLVLMPNLRRLRLEGHELLEYGARPNDADLLRLSAVKALKRLKLSAAPAVTDAGVSRLGEVRPDIVVSLAG